MPGMSEKQRRFVAEYLVDLNATQAAIRAGYSVKTAESQGSRLLRKVQVAEAVQAGQAKRLGKLEITAERVLREIACLAFSDVRKLFDATGRLRPIHELEDDVAAALGSIELEREKTTRKATDVEEVTVEECVVKVKEWDKLRALEMLAKNLGLVKEQHEHGGAGGGAIPFKVSFGGRYRPTP